MKSNRRQFLKAVGAVGAAAAIGTLRVNAAAATPGFAPANVNASTFNPQWQSYVDTGIYPPQGHLFLDDLYISRMEGVGRVIHRPTPENL